MIEVDRIKRLVREHQIDFVICDSIGFACHDAPETAAAALGYFQAVRQLGIGSLHIAHVNRSETGDQKPFGSAFFHNSARATWFVKPTSDDGNPVTLGVFNRKHNLDVLQAPFAIEATFEDARTLFRLADIGAVAEFAGQVPLTQRIRSFLKGGARTRAEIVAQFPDAKPETLRRTIDRELSRDKLVEFPTPGSEPRIGLKARAS